MACFRRVIFVVGMLGCAMGTETDTAEESTELCPTLSHDACVATEKCMSNEFTGYKCAPRITGDFRLQSPCSVVLVQGCETVDGVGRSLCRRLDGNPAACLRAQLSGDRNSSLTCVFDIATGYCEENIRRSENCASESKASCLEASNCRWKDDRCTSSCDTSNPTECYPMECSWDSAERRCTETICSGADSQASCPSPYCFWGAGSCWSTEACYDLSQSDTACRRAGCTVSNDSAKDGAPFDGACFPPALKTGVPPQPVKRLPWLIAGVALAIAAAIALLGYLLSAL